MIKLLKSCATPGANNLKNLTVEKAAEARLPTEFGEFRIAGYRSLTSDEEFVHPDGTAGIMCLREHVAVEQDAAVAAGNFQ